MALQGIKSVVAEGKGGGATLPVAAVARKKGAVLSVTTTTGNVALPLSTNGLPFKTYRVSNVGSDAAYWALGGSVAITAAATATNFDDVLPAGVSDIIVNDNEVETMATHLAAITASGTATLVIAGLV